MSAERFYVRIDRADGSRHYKGPWDRAHCQREADAWIGSFPDYNVSLVPAGDESVRRDVRQWATGTKVDGSGRQPRRSPQWGWKN